MHISTFAASDKRACTSGAFTLALKAVINGDVLVQVQSKMLQALMRPVVRGQTVRLGVLMAGTATATAVKTHQVSAMISMHVTWQSAMHLRLVVPRMRTCMPAMMGEVRTQSNTSGG